MQYVDQVPCGMHRFLSFGVKIRVNELERIFHPSQVDVSSKHLSATVQKLVFKALLPETSTGPSKSQSIIAHQINNIFHKQLPHPSISSGSKRKLLRHLPLIRRSSSQYNDQRNHPHCHASIFIPWERGGKGAASKRQPANTGRAAKCSRTKGGWQYPRYCSNALNLGLSCWFKILPAPLRPVLPCRRHPATTVTAIAREDPVPPRSPRRFSPLFAETPDQRARLKRTTDGIRPGNVIKKGGCR